MEGKKNISSIERNIKKNIYNDTHHDDWNNYIKAPEPGRAKIKIRRRSECECCGSSAFISHIYYYTYFSSLDYL